jgi:sialic acid synthase SpsE
MKHLYIITESFFKCNLIDAKKILQKKIDDKSFDVRALMEKKNKLMKDLKIKLIKKNEIKKICKKYDIIIYIDACIEDIKILLKKIEKEIYLVKIPSIKGGVEYKYDIESMEYETPEGIYQDEDYWLPDT